jgi:hypothetical protein
MPMYDSYRPIRELVRDVDDIDDRRFNGVRKRNIFGNEGLGGGLQDRGISEISKKISNIDINIEKRNNNPLLGINKDIEMESLKKKLYDEIRNDPKYQDAYGRRNSGINNNKYNFNNRPFSFRNNDERKSMQYFSDKPKNDAVYKLMFKKNGELKKSYDISSNDINEENLLLESKSKFNKEKKQEKVGLSTSKLPIGKMLKTKEEVNDILKNLNIDFQI